MERMGKGGPPFTTTLDSVAEADASKLSLTEQLSYSTVRIETDTGTGTGFFYRFAVRGSWHIPAIVTNKHVVEGASSGRFLISRANEDKTPNLTTHETFGFRDFESMWVKHPEKDVDLCAMPIAPILVTARDKNVPLFYRSLDENLIPTPEEFADFNPVEDIVMVGYPNGLWDRVHNLPIFRRGITATNCKLDWNGKAEFLIDCVCFPGSSGSPVMLLSEGTYRNKDGGLVLGGTRVKLLGVLYAGPQHTVEGEIKIVTVPIQDRPVAFSTIPNNLGLVIRSTKLRELDAIFEEKARESKEI